MAIQTINTGAAANDGTGDKARTAFQKANANFADLDTRAIAAQGAASSANTNANNRVARSGDEMTGPLGVSAGALFSSNKLSNGTSRAVQILYPAGGQWSGGSQETGALRIALPQVSGRRCMIRAEVEVFEYFGQTQPSLVTFFGYSDIGGWVNGTAIIVDGGRLSTMPVRFGRDATKRYVYLGDLSHDWRFARVGVRTVLVSYDSSGVDEVAWSRGWSIERVTAFDTVDAVATGNLPFARTDAANVSGLSAYALVTQLDTKANNASPTFTGTPVAPNLRLTGALSSDLRTLDYYEEGEFTPTLLGSTPGSPTYSQQQGRFTRIGNRCLYSIYLVLTGKGGMSGAVTINGLPFTVHASVAARGGASISYLGGMALAAGDYSSIVGFHLGGTPRFSLYKRGPAAIPNLQASDISDTFTLYMSGQYEVA